MKILQFSTNDITGGAAKAAYQQHRALCGAGHTSHMLVRNKRSSDMNVRGVSRALSWGSIIKKIKYKVSFLKELSRDNIVFNFDRDPGIDERFFYNNHEKDIDILGLNWITDFVTAKTIRQLYEHYRCPIVWTLLDVEPITGGCHYTFGCDGYMNGCGNCPQLNRSGKQDASRVVWEKKHRYLKDLPITFVAPTNWIAIRIKESSLFKEHHVEVIPLAIDTEVFCKHDKNEARRSMGLPQDKKIVLLGARSLADPRKGMSYLKAALEHLASIVSIKESSLDNKDIFLLIAGTKNSDILKSLPFAYREMGLLDDDTALARAYQATDVFVCPSIEEAGPMMIPEAMLCGTPVVAFNTGGAPDLIETMKTGYLADYKDALDLAMGVYSLVASDKLHVIGNAAYEIAVKRHSPSVAASSYVDLYRKIKLGLQEVN